MTRLILFYLLWSSSLFAQPAFRTVVPARPVVEGESFTIQYVWEDADKLNNFQVSPFSGLQLINGPVSYKGMAPTPNGIIQVQNFVFTVVANSRGKFSVPLATGNWKGKSIQSNPAVIEVISASEALAYAQKQENNSESFLKPGEDPYKKINDNLFVRVSADKKEVVIGEPVVATYKLYSRLESHSEIVKNPGFYGFSVFDMINLQDKVKTTETVNGKNFDVHLLRKVQLYPLQAGKLMIDAMEIHNSIYFSRSATLKKSEQEIAEGMLGPGDKDPANSDVFENQVSTTPISIVVKPLAEKNKPMTFSGAVGKFNISARVSNSTVAKNEGDSLEVSIEGVGNFIQVSPPIVEWPSGMEGFEASIRDVFDKTQSPLKGKRTFRYPFASAVPGNYTIPPVAFHFFDPDSGRYRTIRTEPISIQVTNDRKRTAAPAGDIPPSTGPFGFWWLLIPVIIILGVLIFIRQRKFGASTTLNKNIPPTPSINVDEWLAEGRILINQDGIGFYGFIRNACWDYFRLRLNLDGSFINKPELAQRLKDRKIDAAIVLKAIRILDHCDQVIFTGASASIPKEELFNEVHTVLEAMEKKLYSAYL